MKFGKQKNTVLLGLAAAGLVLLTGCGKKEVYQTNAGANYPVIWEVEKNGSVTVKLDGSYAPDYTWEAVSSDDTVISVQAGKERKGIVTYEIKPLAAGNASIEFKRIRELEEIPEPVYEEPGNVEDKGKKGKDADTVEETSDEDDEIVMDKEFASGSITIISEDEGGNLVEDQIIGGVTDLEGIEVVDAYDDIYGYTEDIYEPEDIVCRVLMNFVISAKGSSGKKFTTIAAMGGYTEAEGLTLGGEEGFQYRLWRNSDYEMYILLPMTEGFWYMEEESEYAGKIYKDYRADGSIDEEKMYPQAEIDENGNYVILRTEFRNLYRGRQVYALRGIAEGTAKVIFSSPTDAKRIVLEMEMDLYGNVKVTSHQMEDYKPTAEEIARAKGEL